MLKFNARAFAVTSAAGVALVIGFGAQAQTNVTGHVNLTVNNAISITESTPMEFGTFLVVKDTAGANTATLTMASNGTATPSNNAPATFTSVSAVLPAARSQGIFSITGAAASTVINVATSGLNDLNCALCSSSDDILLTSVTPATATVTTDGSGDATINVGAVLTTKTGATQYQDGAYVGTYTLTVNY